jgi:hypothetical protein
LVLLNPPPFSGSPTSSTFLLLPPLA